MDIYIQDSVFTICDLPHHQWTDVAKIQMTIPVRLGGLGFHSIYDLSPVVFLASVRQVFYALTHPPNDTQHTYYDEFSRLLDNPALASSPFISNLRAAHQHLHHIDPKLDTPLNNFNHASFRSGLQRVYTLALHKYNLDLLTSSTANTSPQDRLRLHSLMQPGSTAFLNAIPFIPQLPLSNQRFTMALRLTLDSGLSIVKGLKLSLRATGNAWFVSKSETITSALKKIGRAHV